MSEKQQTIQDLKESSSWPIDWLPVIGLAPILQKQGENLVGVEIGTCRAESTNWLLSECLNIKKLHTIDPFEEFIDWCGEINSEVISRSEEIAHLNLKDFADERINIIKNTSNNVFETFEDDSLDFVFIDGDHSYQGVLDDLTNWYGKVKDGGVVSGHDLWLDDVQKALRQFAQDQKLDLEISSLENQAWYWIKRTK